MKCCCTDLTTGSILRLSGPIAFSMIMFTLYLLIDLYSVGRLGPDTVAAVSISGNAFFVILGLSFVLGIGGMSTRGHKGSQGVKSPFDL